LETETGNHSFITT